MNDPPHDFLQNGHRVPVINASLSKDIGATSPLRFALMPQKSVSGFDFPQELLLAHSKNEWCGSVDCVI
jgi:hypothetical protein